MGYLPSALLSSTSGQAVLRVTVLSSECLPRVSTAYRVNLYAQQANRALGCDFREALGNQCKEEQKKIIAQV